MISEECISQDMAAIADSQPVTRTKPLRLNGVIWIGALIGVLLGAQNILLWVEDWPTILPTNQALAAAHLWHKTTAGLCLADVHPMLRHMERKVEMWGTDEPPPALPDLHCAAFQALLDR